jgi:serine/threonine protein kinase
MNQNTPCPEWEERIAALRSDDLAPDVRAALEVHVATCIACATALADYQHLDELMWDALIMPLLQPIIAADPYGSLRNSSTTSGSLAAGAGQTGQLSNVSLDTPAFPLRSPSGLLKHAGLLSVGVTVQNPDGDGYIIEGLLGRGGFGAVYLAQDQRTRQQFALKEVIDPDRYGRARFASEGELLGRLRHRALPHVHQAFELEKSRRVYLVMDYIAGRDLETLQEDQPGQCFPLSAALTLLAPVVDALGYLHCQDPPIVHRDVKPANIIQLEEGDGTMLVDFSIAKEYRADGTTNIIRQGSRGYAAPEQYRGGTNPRTDIYALGATLYTLLTGYTPPDAILRITADERRDPLVAVNQLVPTIPGAVARAIARAMAIRSEDRFETVEQFWQEVTHAVVGAQRDSIAPPAECALQEPSPPKMFRCRKAGESRWRRQFPALRGRKLLQSILAVLIGIVIFGSCLSFPGRERPSPARPRVSASSVSSPPAWTFNYPELAPFYGGTIFDVSTTEKTPLFLTDIRQDQGNIRGTFLGLGSEGPFRGTVTSSGQVQLTMLLSAQGKALSFEGDIKLGGDMTGWFHALNADGHRPGEYGLWNVSPLQRG